GETDARRLVVLADGIEQGQPARLLADATPDRGADGVATSLRCGVFGLGVLTRLDEQTAGLIAMLNNRGNGMEFLQVPGTRPIVSPPFGGRQDARRQAADRRFLPGSPGPRL